jgi:hypothetical protein
LVSYCQSGHAQGLLNKTISIDVRQQRLDNVLEIISNKGNFYFSYSSNIVRKDSLVSLSANKTVGQILDQLFPDHYEFRESGNYIIIRKQPIRVNVVTNKGVTDDKFYVVSGYVLDDQTANWIQNASVYEKTLLVSTLTNENGYFKLKLKQKARPAAITVSKEFYRDTSFAVDPRYNQEITVTLLPVTTGAVTIIGPDDYFAPDQLKLRVKQSDSSFLEYTYTKTDSAKVEKTGMGKFLLSSKQEIQSLNLKKFFTERPFQLSVAPGLSTHGQMAPQVINNFSLNVFGGYSGGVEGGEIGGIFNIDKKEVRYFQAAGVFNIVGGQMHGFQVAGVSNTVLDSAKGFQVAGVHNMVQGKFAGFQVSGVYNHVNDSVKGVQVAGVGNFSKGNMGGTQIAGFMNFANHTTRGVQVAGVINYTKHLKGVQIGLINICDTSQGVGIGLINIVIKGYHKLSFYTDEVVNANAAFKTGNRKLYTILQAGMNFSDSNEVFTFGYGLGSELRLGKIISLNPEISAQQLYLGSWDFPNILSKFRLNLNVKLGKYVTLFGGPVYNVYYTEQDVHFAGYRQNIPPSGYKTHTYNSNVKGWLGWNAGVSFF